MRAVGIIIILPGGAENAVAQGGFSGSGLGLNLDLDLYVCMYVRYCP